MGSDESHFSVLLILLLRGRSHETVSTNHNFWRQKGEPKRGFEPTPSAYQPNAWPLGQTGSHTCILSNLPLKASSEPSAASVNSVSLLLWGQHTGLRSPSLTRQGMWSLPSPLTCLLRTPSAIWTLPRAIAEEMLPNTATEGQRAAAVFVSVCLNKFY